MTMRFEIADPTGRAGWDDLVLASPGYSIFHTSWWARVLRDSYGYRPCYLARIEGGRFSALVPLMEIRSLLTGRKGVCLPFTDYCDPIVTDRTLWAGLLDRLKAFGKTADWKYIELRGKASIDTVPCSSYYHHRMDLAAGIDELFANLSNKVKRNIRKAERSGVVIKRSNTPDALRAYYELHCLTRKKHGLPPQPMKFFLSLFEQAITRDYGQVVLAEYRGRQVAGGVFLHFGREAIYKYGASNAKYLNVCPNHLLLWETIRQYAEQGYSHFSFGRTDLHNQGLLEFKQGWGGEETKILYHRYDLRREAFVPGSSRVWKLSPNIFGSLPVPALKLAGSLLYRHMG